MPRPSVRLLIPCTPVALAALAALAAWSCRPLPLRAPPEISAGDALAHARTLGLEVLPDSPDGDPATGCWLIAPGADESRERLVGLMRQRAGLPGWRGVVLMKPERHPNDTLYRQLAEWGDAGLYAPPLVFFGDPDLIHRMRQALGDAALPQAALTAVATRR
jgi:hypothetical protein